MILRNNNMLEVLIAVELGLNRAANLKLGTSFMVYFD